MYPDLDLRIRQMGFINTPRFILDLLFYPNDEIQSMTRLYLFLHTKAFFKANDIMVGKTKVHVNRGEYCGQKQKIREVLQMSRVKFDRYLHTLEELKWIKVIRKGNIIIFRIVNYDLFNVGNPDQPRQTVGHSGHAALEGQAAYDDMRMTMGGECLSMYGPGNILTNVDADCNNSVWKGGVQ